MTGYGLDGWGSIPGWGKRFFSSLFTSHLFSPLLFFSLLLAHSTSKGEPMEVDLLDCKFPPSLHVPVSFCMRFALFAACFKMEAIFSSQMPVDFHQNTQHYISEDKTLHNHCYENLKSNNFSIIVHSLYNRMIFLGELCPI
jgi:hypothetical protein